MEHGSADSGRFEELKERILEQVDLSREVPDDEMRDLIDEVVLASVRENYLPLNEKCRLKKELFPFAVVKMEIWVVCL